MTIRHDFSRSNIFHVFSNDFINTQFFKLGCTDNFKRVNETERNNQSKRNTICLENSTIT